MVVRFGPARPGPNKLVEQDFSVRIFLVRTVFWIFDPDFLYSGPEFPVRSMGFLVRIFSGSVRDLNFWSGLVLISGPWTST